MMHTTTTDRRSSRHRRAQAIILAGFILAIGIVGTVVLLNTAVESVSLEGQGEGEAVTSAINFRHSMVRDAQQGIEVVNDVSVSRELNNSEVNQTYVDYMKDLEDRLQNMYAGEALIDIRDHDNVGSDIQVNTSFDNAWMIQKNRSSPAARTVRDPFDVVMVLDASGSMGSNYDAACNGGGTQRIICARQAARGFVAEMKPPDRAGVVNFDADSGYERNGIIRSVTYTDSSAAKNRINGSIDEVGASGSTYAGGGLREGVDDLVEHDKAGQQQYVILLTDGENTEGWMHFPQRYVKDGGVWRHEWGYSNDDEMLICRTRSDCGNEPETDLNDRTRWQAERAADESVTVMTVGFGDPDDDLLEDVANITGGTYYCDDPSECSGNSGDLESIFQQILDQISEPQRLATEINETFRMAPTVTDITEQGNYTMQVLNESNSVVWNMNVTNQSSSHAASNHVVISDGSQVLHKYDYTDPAIDGVPLSIEVMEHRINGVSRNLSNGLILNASNYSVRFTKGTGFNHTYDVRVDDNANVSSTPCGAAPCSGPRNATVGSIHNVSFEIGFTNDQVNYTEAINITANPIADASESGSAAPITSPPSGPTDVLNFTTPLYEYDSYWQLDEFDPTVPPSPSTPYSEDFEGSLDGTTGGDVDLNDATYNSSDTAAAIGSEPSVGGPGVFTTDPIDLAGERSAQVAYWLRQGWSSWGDDSYSETPDGDDHLFVEWKDSDGDWNNLRTLDGGDPTDIESDTHCLPPDALHSGFQLRFRHEANNYWDDFHLDDVTVKTDHPCGIVPEGHAFDQSYHGHTLALDPGSPTINQTGVENASYHFDGDQALYDNDGWNDIPIEGKFTISMWFKPDSPPGGNFSLANGTLFDMSRDDEHFQLALDEGTHSTEPKLVWRYDGDSDIEVRTPNLETFEPGVGDFENWHHVAVTGGWNSRNAKIFHNGTLLGKDLLSTSGSKPMQSPVESDERLAGTMIGRNINDEAPPHYGFDGKIDEVRIYHDDISDFTLAGGTRLWYENFEDGSLGPTNFTRTTGDAQVTSYVASSGTESAQIGNAGSCGWSSDPGTIESSAVDLSSVTDPRLRFWVHEGQDSGVSNRPEAYDPEDLIVEYHDAGGTWRQLDELQTQSDAAVLTGYQNYDLPAVTGSTRANHSTFQVRFRHEGGNGCGDYWHVDDVELRTPGTPQGDAGFVPEVYQEIVQGFTHTAWKNYSGNVAVDNLAVVEPVIQRNGGSIDVWVQSDPDNDDAPEENSTRIRLDGNPPHTVAGLSTDTNRFRLKVRVNHPQENDGPKFFSAKLKSR